MAKPRGREHSTLTETAAQVVKELYKVPGVKMIAPGEIRTTHGKSSGKRYVTIVHTTSGCELIISGQSVQKIAVHTTTPTNILSHLKNAKALRAFSFSERDRKPGE